MGERRKTADGRILEMQSDGTILDVTPANSQIEATPLPRNPYEVQREQRDFSVDRGDRGFDEAKKLRDEYRQSEGVVTYEAALGTFNAAQNTAASSQGDQSLITAYAKMLDPNSAVREGEFATTASTERTIDQLKAKLAKELGWREGGMLTPEGRSAIREEMRNLVVSRFKPAYERQRSYYQRLAGEYGIPAERVLVENLEDRFPADMLDPPKVEENLSVATGSSEADELPQEYQNAHYNYLSQNWNDIDPDDYVRFRTALDERYGQTAAPESYRQFATTANAFAQQGGRPAELGAVPSPTSEMGAVEGLLNSAAQSRTGAFIANSGNATAFGLPARMTGNQERLEDIRDINPGASIAGEVFGGVAGTGVAGAGLGGIAKALNAGRASSLISNPATANALYGTTYGATQDDNALRGAGTGLAASFAGDIAGRTIARGFPQTFNRSGFRAADDAVPSVDDLQESANRLYQQAENAGVTADPAATSRMLDEANGVLNQYGYLGPQGEIVGSGPLQDAVRLLRQYDGLPMTPTQAGAARKAIGRGRTAMDGTKPDMSQRSASGNLLNRFDDWAEPALPGVEDARAVSQRAILGREMENANEQAAVKASQYTQSGDENALRTVYRGMDMNNVRGRNSYPPELAKKIEEVARGTPFTNRMRDLGKFAPTGPVSTMASLGAGGVGASALGPIGVAATPIMMATGLFGRRIAGNAKQRAAKEAALMARGGKEYEKAILEAAEEARRRGGAIGAGLSVAPASNYTR